MRPCTLNGEIPLGRSILPTKEQRASIRRARYMESGFLSIYLACLKCESAATRQAFDPRGLGCLRWKRSNKLTYPHNKFRIVL